MTKRCEFYQVHVSNVRSGLLNADRMPRTERTEAPWCSHPKHSPADLTIAVGAIGGGRALRCGGDLSKCPLTREQFDDRWTTTERDDGTLAVGLARSVGEALLVVERYAREHDIELSDQQPRYRRTGDGDIEYDFFIMREPPA